MNKEKFTIKELLKELFEDGFFDKPKLFRDINKELLGQGLSIPTTTLHPAIANFMLWYPIKRRKNKEYLWEYYKDE